jgi:hypothetical protein
LRRCDGFRRIVIGVELGGIGQPALDRLLHLAKSQHNQAR